MQASQAHPDFQLKKLMIMLEQLPYVPNVYKPVINNISQFATRTHNRSSERETLALCLGSGIPSPRTSALLSRLVKSSRSGGSGGAVGEAATCDTSSRPLLTQLPNGPG